jgi:hypothetical protein
MIIIVCFRLCRIPPSVVSWARYDFMVQIYIFMLMLQRGKGRKSLIMSGFCVFGISSFKWIGGDPALGVVGLFLRRPLSDAWRNGYNSGLLRHKKSRKLRTVWRGLAALSCYVLGMMCQ